MEPKGKPPLSDSDKLAAVDVELETAMERLTETNERIDRVLTNLEENPDANDETQDDFDAAPEAESVDGEAES
ncbi:MAG: hypothetical protein QGD90_11885 [Candidatus Hydrogenedentes bacterium]|nr:hypothetical protein [Candidatus Hydrogenedentota bacterium]